MQKCNTERNELDIKSKDDLLVFLDSLEEKYEHACFRMGLANWNSYSKEGPYDLDAAKDEFKAIFSDSVAKSAIEEWRARSSSLADKVLARRLELWHRCFMGGTIYADPEIAKLENALQKKISNYSFMLDGVATTRAAVANRLRVEKKQAERHKLWSVDAQLSAIASADLVHLVTLRNEKAKRLGFPNYYSLALSLQAIDEKWLLKTLNNLEEQTREKFSECIDAFKSKLGIDDFGPWDFDFALHDAVSLPDRFFPADSVFSVIHHFERSIGFGVDSLPIQEFVKDIPFGGLSLAINIPKDSRFLVNPTKGKGFYEVAFHEYGHSLKAVYTDVEFPIFKGYEWIPGAQCPAYEEGIADLHREFTDDSLWLSQFTKAKAKQIESYIKGCGLAAVYQLRRLLKDFFIEHEMYTNPEANVAACEREMFKKYLLVDIGEDEPHHFASSIWYSSYPCYYQNYVLAAMIATQIQEALTNKFGPEKVRMKKVSKWLINHLYATGEQQEWTERIRDATGKSLEIGAYLRKLGIESMRSITRE